MEKQMKIALLIDAENILPCYADQIFSSVSSLGNIEIKEIYGSPFALSTWSEPIYKHLINPNLSVRTTKGKNTSDIALVIGAMDLLAQSQCDIIAIASSDSDFSPLAVRLRKSNQNVIGIGASSAPATWKVACSNFIILDDAFPFNCNEEFSSEELDSSLISDPLSDNTSSLRVPNNPCDRRIIISNFIKDTINAFGGKMPFVTLCGKLSQLPAYQIDKQTAGMKKAHQYISTFYSDLVQFENGTEFVVLHSFSDEIIVESSPEQQNTDENNEQQHVLSSASDAAQINAIVSEGIPSEIADDIWTIMQSADNKLNAYNQIRAKYGNDQGTDYYHKVRTALNTVN